MQERSHIPDMERRTFLRSLAAAMTAPALPVGAMAQPSLSPGLYARAVSFASGGAYFSEKFLASSLGVNQQIGTQLIAKLKANGMIAEMGKTGLMSFKGIHAKHALMTAQAIKAPLQQQRPALEQLRNLEADFPNWDQAPDLRVDISCDCSDQDVTEDDADHPQLH